MQSSNLELLLCILPMLLKSELLFTIASPCEATAQLSSEAFNHYPQTSLRTADAFPAVAPLLPKNSFFFWLIFNFYKFLKIFKTKLVSSTLRTVAVKLVYSPTRFV